MKLRTIFTTLCLTLVVAGCGSANTEETNIASKEVNEYGVEESTAEAITVSIEEQYEAMNSGDLESVLSYYHEFDEEDQTDTQDFIDLHPTITLTSLEVVYVKDNEALAIVKGKVMAQEYNENDNINQEFTSATIFHNEEAKWLEGDSYNMEVIYLDGAGTRSDDFYHIDNTETIQAKIDDIKSNEILPSEYMIVEENLLDEAEKSWESLYGLYTIESADQIGDILSNTFLNPADYSEAYQSLADTYLSFEYVDIESNFHSGMITANDDSAFSYQAYVSSTGITESGERHTLDNGIFKVDMAKDENGEWKIAYLEQQ
ncbi:hypothetical protein [Radiobacillus sp. PE A8.2]|uniref:hypothetical protein n=1 Tax=Radiobacillus sp. PE A8.2 TaxID=3380349 RepID=UPI003890BA99